MFCNIYRQIKKAEITLNLLDTVIITHLGVVSVAIIKENIAEMTAEIDLKTNGIYIVKNGQVQLIQPPQGGFGEQSFTYKDGKVIRMDERKTLLI